MSRVTVEFVEMGGYDCMSDAFIIQQRKQVLAEVDVRHYTAAQSGMDKLSATMRAKRVADIIAAALDVESKGNLF